MNVLALHTWCTNTFATVIGDKMAMRLSAKLL